MTKDQLDAAPGFDSSHWPNVADPKWAASIDTHYKSNRNNTAPANDATLRPNGIANQNREPVEYETVFPHRQDQRP